MPAPEDEVEKRTELLVDSTQRAGAARDPLRGPEPGPAPARTRALPPHGRGGRARRSARRGSRERGRMPAHLDRLVARAAPLSRGARLMPVRRLLVALAVRGRGRSRWRRRWRSDREPPGVQAADVRRRHADVRLRSGLPQPLHHHAVAAGRGGHLPQRHRVQARRRVEVRPQPRRDHHQEVERRRARSRRGRRGDGALRDPPLRPRHQPSRGRARDRDRPAAGRRHPGGDEPRDQELGLRAPGAHAVLRSELPVPRRRRDS